VSLLSPERLTAFLAPDGAIAVRRSGWRAGVVDKRSYVVEASGEKGTRAAIAGLAAAVSEMKPRSIGVILSNHFVNYALAPWRDDLKDEDEEIAVARLAFTETYGDEAAGWHVRLSGEVPGRARIAAALPAAFLAEIQRVCAEAKVRLVAVQPYLAAATNAFRRHFSGDRSAWLVVHEEGRLCFAFIERGRWRWVRCARAPTDWRNELPELLDNESLLAGVEAQPAEALVFAPTVADLSLRGGTRWPFHALRLAAGAGFSPITDAAFSAAMLG
jgi:hypothetical protein